MASSSSLASNSKDPLHSLTSERVALFEEAIRLMRQAVNEHIRRNHDSYWSIGKRNQAVQRRLIYIGVLGKILGNQEGINIRGDNGGFFLVLDSESVVHPKKLNPKTLLAWLPRTLERDENFVQLPLDGFINEENIPLNQLQGVVAGFVENKLGELVDFYFTVQNGDEIVARLQLGITTTIPFESALPDDDIIPSVKFKAVKKKSEEA